MNSKLVVVLVLLVSAVAMFALNKPRMDVVAILILTGLPFTGVITMSESPAGFADPNTVLIAALFAMGEGLVRTGVARKFGDPTSNKTGNSEVKMIVLRMI